MNRVVLISYDLRKPGQDYERLHDAIKSLGSWWHYLESTWMVDANESVETIAEFLRGKIDRNDRLLVTEVVASRHEGWLTKDAWLWLQTHGRPSVTH